jgi:capsular exopolysaccharide synthesis family protein
LFRVSNINGLISYLLDSSVRTEDVVIPVKGVENLWVIPSGPLPPNPSEALGSRRMHDLIEDLRTKYDFVIIDSAPVLGMADATVLAGQVDGTLMVVRSGTVVRDAAIAAKDQLMASKGRLLGVVLNGVGVAPGGYYYYYDSNNHERKRKHRHSY